MKKIALLIPILVAGPLALAAACGGEPVDMDGSGGADGSGGDTQSGGSNSDGTGGATGGNPGTGGSTGGTENLGGFGGFGGFGGMGGMGGTGSGELTLQEACETMCATAVAGDASDCDEGDCVVGCADTYATYYAGYGCDAEYLELKQCSAELDGSAFACSFDIVVTDGCLDEQVAVEDCLL